MAAEPRNRRTKEPPTPDLGATQKSIALAGGADPPLRDLPPHATMLPIMPQPTYSILPDSLDALAAALAGAIPFRGRLPVSVPGFAA